MPLLIRSTAALHPHPPAALLQIGFCERMGTPAKKRADGGYEAGDCKHFDQVAFDRQSRRHGPLGLNLPPPTAVLACLRRDG